MNRVSICMATYNGELYVRPQILSILAQMNANDELVIVDDHSNDGTVSILSIINDSRIRFFQNEKNIGHVQSFAKAISLALNPIILMADQDDIWIKDRLKIMHDSLCDNGVLLVSTNSIFIDASGNPIKPLHSGLRIEDSRRYAKNIVNIFFGKAFYDGCAMCINREILDYILPIPRYVESHDLWIAMAANIAKSNSHLSIATLQRRVHGGNASVGKRSFFKKIWSRVVFVISFAQLSLRINKF